MYFDIIFIGYDNVVTKIIAEIWEQGNITETRLYNNPTVYQISDYFIWRFNQK